MEGYWNNPGAHCELLAAGERFVNDFLNSLSKRTVMSPVQHLISVVLLIVLPTLSLSGEFKVEGIEGNPSNIRFLAPAERGSGFRPDERFEFRAAWGIFGAAATIIVATDMEPNGGRKLFHIRSNAKTNGLIRAIYPADTRTDSFLDPDSWSVLSSHLEGRSGSEDNKALTIIDYDRRLVIHEDDIKPEESYTHPLPMDPVLDYVSAVLQMRGLPLKVGKSFPVFVHGGGKFYLVFVDIVGHEVKNSTFGKIPSFVLKPRMEKPTGIFARGGGVTMWVTDDEYRLPTRVDVNLGFGTAAMILDRYEAPGVEMGKKRRR
jgi:hypothetical protein